MFEPTALGGSQECAPEERGMIVPCLYSSCRACPDRRSRRGLIITRPFERREEKSMASPQADPTVPTPYISFTHDEWGQLRAATPLTLNERDLVALRGINERISLDE